MKKIISIILITFICSISYSQKLKKMGYIFDKTTYSFGDVEQWNNQAAIFTFTNNTNSELSILPLFSENDLDVVLPEKSIKKGETIIIKAMYYTAGKGPFSRSFPIYFGQLKDPIYLKITGNIKSLSPEAYIQCPMSKPEMAKQKIELIGDVAEIDSEIPLSGAQIQITGLQSKTNIDLYTNSKGNFGVKLPVGNYIVKVIHPNYLPFTGTTYVGQTSPPLRIRLTPITLEKTIADIPKRIEREKEEDIDFALNESNIEKIDFNDEELKKTDPFKSNNTFIEDEVEKAIEDERIKEEEEEEEEAQKEKEKRLKTLDTDKDDKDDKEINKPFEDEEKAIVSPEKDLPKKDDKPLIIKERKTEEPIIIYNSYTFRVIDEGSLEPIKNSSLFINDLYNKKNRTTEKTNERGYSEVEIDKSDYRIVATADGYISNEIKILKEDKSDIYKIYLSPVSSLYNDIYEANKKTPEEEQEILDKLSFGKDEFTFAENDIEKEEPFKIEKVETNTTPIEEKEPLIVEKLIRDKEKEDSLTMVIEELEVLNKKEAELKEKEREKELNLAKVREQDMLDSLNSYIAELINKNKEIKDDLNTIEGEKLALEKENENNKNSLEALESKNSELEEKEILDPFSVKKYAANNIIFLIDVSTSMGKNNKIDMLKTSIKNLTGILRDIDRVAIITYNQQTNTILESVNGNNKTSILSALDSLETGGLTNGVRGITSAYEMLEYYYLPEGNNQIILATDGLFSKYNNEMTENELNRLVKKKADNNMKLTVVGFGKENDGKELMEKLAKNGTGQYIQIKNEYMTRDVLIKEVKLNSIKTETP